MSGGHEDHVVVPTGLGAALEVLPAQAVFGVIVLILPADPGKTDEARDRGVGRQVGQPVAGGCLGPFRQLDQ